MTHWITQQTESIKLPLINSCETAFRLVTMRAINENNPDAIFWNDNSQ